MRRVNPVSAAAAALLVAGGVVMAVPTEAAADTATFTDRHNDARRALDIERVRVDNAHRIVVAVGYDNLRRHSSGGLGVYFDTRGPDRGPEYVAVGGLDAAGSDWQAIRVENWRGANATLLPRCDIDFRIRYGQDTATFDIARACFKRPGRIRVAARSSGSQSSQRDWAPKRHRFYDWVRR